MRMPALRIETEHGCNPPGCEAFCAPTKFTVFGKVGPRIADGRLRVNGRPALGVRRSVPIEIGLQITSL